MDVIHDLVRVVLRSFYDEKSILLADFLLHERMLSDEELAERLKIVLKDVNRTAAKLREDRLLRTEARQELRPSDQKPVTRTFYYIDYKQFVDVVKYRMYRMRKGLEDSMKNEAEKKGYQCPSCHKSLGALEMQGLLDPARGVFECDLCGAEIEEHNDSEQLRSTQELHSLLMDQLSQLLRLLRRTDSLSIPAFDPIEYLKQKAAFGRLSAAPSSESVSLASAASSAAAKRAEVSVEIQTAEPAGDGKGLANELPVWHTHSTITGELVRGFGASQASSATASNPSLDQAGQDSSDHNSDELRRYYESLQEPAHALPRKRIVPEELPPEAPSEPSDQTVLVAGQPKLFVDITDEDKTVMTPDEYAHYYEVYMANM